MKFKLGKDDAIQGRLLRTIGNHSSLTFFIPASFLKAEYTTHIIQILVFIFTLSIITPSHADDLASYLVRVKRRNLDIGTQSAITLAAQERSKGFSLKPPMFGVGQMKNSEDTAYAFEVQQEFPLSSRLSDDKSVREFKFELQKKESSYVSQEILLQARLAFVNYWMSYKKLQLIEELRDWLKKHVRYAQSQVRSSSDIKVYALEIESAVGIYENDASSLKNRLEIEKTELKEMAYDQTYDPGEPTIDDPRSLPEASATSRISSINLSKLKIAKSNLDVAKSAYSPNLSVRVLKLDRPMFGMANQEIMLGVDLPFAYFWQPRAEKAEAMAQKSVAEANYRKTEVETEALRESLKKRAVIIKNQIETLNRVSIPAAEQRLKYLKNISPRDVGGLESHHKIFQDYIELKTQLLEIRVNHEELYANWVLLFSEGKLDEI